VAVYNYLVENLNICWYRLGIDEAWPPKIPLLPSMYVLILASFLHWGEDTYVVYSQHFIKVHEESNITETWLMGTVPKPKFAMRRQLRRRTLIVEKNAQISKRRQVLWKRIAAQLGTIETRVIETVSWPKFAMGVAREANLDHWPHSYKLERR